MEIADLQALLWLHRHGSLQAAARASGVARTTLRRRLERLEASTGRELARFDGSGVQLTPAGEVLVTRGHDLVVARDALAREARHARSTNDTLRLLLPLGIAPRLVARVLAGLAETLPSVRLSIDFDRYPLERLRDTYDAVLHWGDAPRHQDGFTRELARFPLRVQGSASYLERFGVPEHPEDLAGHRVVHWVGQRPAWPRVDGGEIPYEPRFETTDFFALGCMVGAGMGLGLVPAPGFDVDPAVDTLQPVLEDVVRATGALRIYIPEPTSPDSAVAALAGHIDELRVRLDAVLRGLAPPAL